MQDALFHSGDDGDVLAGLAAFAVVLEERDCETQCRNLSPPWETFPVIDQKRFVEAGTRMSGAGFWYFISRYLLDGGFHLEEIARAGAAKDLAGVARHARILADAGAGIGALRTAAAARRLEDACRPGNDRQVRRLIAALKLSCTESEMALRGVLDDALAGAA